MNGHKVLAGALITSLALLFGSGTATAHQSPPGCATSSLNPLIVSGPQVMHRNGEVVNIVAGYRNPAANSCDVTDFKITVTLPKPDGTAGGQTIVAGEHLTALGSTGNVSLPAVQFTPNFNPGVYQGPVTVTQVGGIFHGATDSPNGDGSTTSMLSISRPHVTMSVTPSVTTSPADGNVKYTYLVHNDSTSFPGDTGTVSMVNSQITDDRCAPVAYVSGDGGFTNWLDPGETWTFTCTTRLNKVGAVTSHASYTGTSIRDSVPAPITATAETTVNTHGADMTLQMSQNGGLVRGSSNSYSLVATNSGNDPADSQDPTVVTATLPAGLTATSIAGTGWTCVLASLTCSQLGTIPAGASLPPVSVAFDISLNAPEFLAADSTVTNNKDADPSNNAGHVQSNVVGPFPVADKTAPVLGALRFAPKKFKAKKGTAITFSLSEPSSVVFSFQHKVKKKGKKAKWKPTAGSIKVDGVSGTNKVKFFGRLKGKTLKPGTYRASAIATDAAGNKSQQAAPAGFTILRERGR